VYGGDDGWEFIEEGCYSLLLETILEKINAPQKKVKIVFIFFNNKN
jgi:hypothetical protein